MEIIKNPKNKIIFCMILALFFLLWILPIYNDGIADVIAKSGYIDGSWKIGINWATVNGLKFGKDIVFSYGPLYFLSDNSLLNINRPLYFGANILSIILCFLSLFLFAKFIIERLDFSELKYKIFSHIVILLALYSFLCVYIELAEFLLLLSFLLLFSLVEKTNRKKDDILWTIFIGFIFSILSLVKFYYFIAVVTLTILSIVIFITIKKSYILISLVGSFIIFLISIWLILEKSLFALLLYIKNGFALTFGYSEGLQLYFEDWQGKFLYEGRFIIIYAVLIFALWAGLLIYGIAKKSKDIIFYFLLSSPILFLIYKQGYTRMDHFHTQEYFRFLIFLLVFTLLIFGKKLWKIFPLLLILILIALPFRAVDETLNIRRKISYNLNEVSKAVKIINPSSYKEMQLYEKEEVRKMLVDYEDAIKRINKGDKVDIIPNEVVVPYVFDLNWSPRPIFQSVNMYNSTLNILNANHFKGKDAPSKVIYHLDAIDGRYAIFDEPLVFQELLKNYNFIYSNDKGIGVLEKKAEETDYNIKTISKDRIKFNQIIDVPDVDNGYLFCKIDIKLNFIGRIKNLLYKGNYIQLKFYFRETTKGPVTVRIIRENGNIGFFIQNYVGDINQLKEIFQQQGYHKVDEDKIKSIEIITNGTSSFYNNFDIEFFMLEFP